MRYAIPMRYAIVLASVLVLAQTTLGQAVQWRVENGGNGHWYELQLSPRTWTAARLSAEAERAHLATITSAAENAFIVSLGIAQTPTGSALSGGMQSGEACEPGCGWGWITGEPFTYSNWLPGEPNNSSGDEGYLEIRFDQKWNDNAPTSTLPAVVEWSSDCNNDGIVDYGQLLSGQLPDANGNGVPDGCDQLLVPQQYATIQAAINVAVDGATVLVSPGTYAPFDYLSKRIEVRSVSGASVTTINATGFLGSAVVFGARSTFASTLRGFKILTGSGGVVHGPYRAGGGCVLVSEVGSPTECAATIEDCVFIGASGGCGYGAGIYARRSGVAVRRCRFDGLHTQHFGPALYVTPGCILPVPSDPTYGSIIEDCYIGHSSSYNDGGMYLSVNYNPIPVRCRVSRCEFDSNSASYQAGAILAEAFPNGTGGELRVENCVFHGNLAPVSDAITSQRFQGVPGFTLRLHDSLIWSGGTSVNIGVGSALIGGNRYCSGNGNFVAGPWTNLGGNVATCPELTDCDGDGRPDVYEIVLGEDTDSDGDGLLDSCEPDGIHSVPSEYPTIQAAINAFPLGTAGIVQVAAGTFNQSFSLNEIGRAHV